MSKLQVSTTKLMTALGELEREKETALRSQLSQVQRLLTALLNVQSESKRKKMIALYHELSLEYFVNLKFDKPLEALTEVERGELLAALNG